MRELSLHVLDLIENSIRAGATVISVAVNENIEFDLFEMTIEDNGSGLNVPPAVALDPYYTTKQGKHTGLGLSLFQASAEQAGGGIFVGRSALGGVAVHAHMRLRHVDRLPLGDLATTLSSVVCTNPGLDVWCRIESGDRVWVRRSSDVASMLDAGARCGLSIARRFCAEIRAGLSILTSEAKFPESSDLANARNRFLWEQRRSEKTMREQSTCCCAEKEVSEEELMRRLDEIIEEYRDKPGALIPVLQIAQGIFGYLPSSALKRISLGLNKSYSEVAGVVGFYSFFSTVPRGKHMVRVCLGTACYVRGGKRVLAALKQKLGIDVGETTADRLFSLDVARCFGACGLAPTIAVGDEVHQRVKPAKIQEILDQYRNRSRVTA